MRKVLYFVGRLLQLTALMTLPFAIWVGHFERNERLAIIIFISAIFMFLIGWLISCVRSFYES